MQTSFSSCAGSSSAARPASKKVRLAATSGGAAGSAEQPATLLAQVEQIGHYPAEASSSAAQPAPSSAAVLHSLHPVLAHGVRMNKLAVALAPPQKAQTNTKKGWPPCYVDASVHQNKPETWPVANRSERRWSCWNKSKTRKVWFNSSTSEQFEEKDAAGEGWMLNDGVWLHSVSSQGFQINNGIPLPKEKVRQLIDEHCARAGLASAEQPGLPLQW